MTRPLIALLLAVLLLLPGQSDDSKVPKARSSRFMVGQGGPPPRDPLVRALRDAAIEQALAGGRNEYAFALTVARGDPAAISGR